MKFNIVNKNGTRWVYDNLTNQIENLSNCPNNIAACRELFPWKLSKASAPRISPDAAFAPHPRKNRLVSKLRIQVGLNCNYKCSFCIQSDEEMKSPVLREDDVKKFFDMLDRENIQVKENGKIELWGGEPLVYWKTLKTLLPELRRRYPKCVISMISNGTLINDEILKFLIDHQVRLVFSHDGPAYFLRGPDPLDDEEKRAMWIKTFHSYQEAGLSFGLNTVISQYNADLFAMQDFFAEKLHPKLNFGFEGVVIAHSPNAIEFTRFPKDAAIKLRESILRGVVLEPESNVGSALYKRSRGLLARIVNEVPALSIVGRCDACDPDSLGIDMFGNVLSCHNVDAKRESIGHIERFDEIRGNKFTHWSLRDYCHDCYVLNGCQGNCLRLDGFLHKAGCDVEKMFHGFIFEAVWILLTGSEIQSISPVTD